MKKILGLDIGTNSIGGALIEMPELIDDFGKEGKILWLGSRIIPINGDYLQKFERGGQTVTKAASRREKRGSRRLKHRYVLRRTRIIKVFKLLGWINENFPEDFKKELRNNPDFKFNIGKFLPFDKSSIDEAAKLLGVKNKDGKLAFSEDWVIYYLRKKALTKRVSLSELSRIIYMMNQRRGFKSGRKDLRNIDESAIEKKWVETLVIDSVIKKAGSDKSKDGKTTYEISAGKHKWEVKRKEEPEWEGKTYTLLFTEKNGKLSTPQVPGEDDWELMMVALDNKIEDSGKQVGEFFFDELVNDKNYKIRQQVVKRSKYRRELEAIWEKQSEFHTELKDKSRLPDIAKLLYKNNIAKQKEISDRDLLYVFSNDIIYYQRDLKSQKSLIGGCQYEKVKYKFNGEERYTGVRVAPVSSPEYQEFRIWQDIHNIRIFQKEKSEGGNLKLDVDVTKDFINNEIKEKLFQLFDNSYDVTQNKIFTILDNKDISENTHFINLFKSREKLKGNETKEFFRKVFNKNNFIEEGSRILNDKKKFYKLWHILYSITSSDEVKSKKGIKSALSNPKNDLNLPEEIIEILSGQPELKKDYKSFSSKAINKLLTVMRTGNYFDVKEISESTKDRIEKICNGEFDEGLDDFTRDNIIKFFKREKEKNLKDISISDFQGLPTWLACYVIYGRHSEKMKTEKYKSFSDIDVMKLVPNNSLRNPVVEQVTRETLNVVRDVWKNFGQPDEIHIELGRELKKNSEERKKISDTNESNRSERERIKKLLYELINENFEEYVDKENKVLTKFVVKPNPESPLDIDKFRIWKSCSDDYKEENTKIYSLEKLFKDGNKEKSPTLDEIKKYTLWLSQKCISPYTGKIIQLSKLFTTEYQVEHIIPRSKLKYDSMDNLVICESAINPEPYKGNKLARLFIRQHSGQTLNINNVEYTIFTEDCYEQHCKTIFRGAKLKNLLCEEIPDGFISRQLNDTRYITKKLNELLDPVSKNKEGLVFTIGSITSELKQNWGMNEVWKELLRPRFERLEKITDRKFIHSEIDDKGEKIHFHVSDNPRFELKRIDHRHHALDALIIAATTREHIRYLSSLNAVDSNEELKNVKKKLVKGKIRDFSLPWNKFTEEAKEKLDEVIVSFKSDKRIISKPKNKYLKWVERNGEWRKEFVNQKQKRNWLSVRRSMYKENPLGIIWIKQIKKVNIAKAVEIEMERRLAQNTIKQKTASYIYNKEHRELIRELISRLGESISEIKKHLKKNPLLDTFGNKVDKIEIAEFVEYAANRVKIDKSFTEKKIETIPYATEGKSPIAVLLKKHLKEEYQNKPNEAFEGEGLENLFKKMSKPIRKITTFEKKADPISFQGKIFEPDAGGIAYFVIYKNKSTKKHEKMYSISVHEVVQRKIEGKAVADEKENFEIILLSPGDLVYVPTKEEIIDPKLINWADTKSLSKRVYKMVKSTRSQCYFIPHYVSKLISSYDEDKESCELGSQNCSEKTFNDEEFIKNSCIKIQIDRLGNIRPVV